MIVALSFATSIFAGTSSNSLSEKKNLLRWKDGKININLSISVSKAAPNFKRDSDVLGAVKRSLSTWENVANIKFIESISEQVSVSPPGNSGDGISLITVSPTTQNLVLFGEDTDDVSAKTRVFYNKSGYISEADIALNPYVQFSTDGTFGTFDLESTLTHEIGHLLGLEHSDFCGSSMHSFQARNGIYNLSQTFSRTLSNIDISNVRAIYGAPESVSDCCGSIKGKLTLPTGKPAANFRVWIEEFSTGKVKAGGFANSDGIYSLDGISSGRYRVYAQDTDLKQKLRKKVLSGDLLGEISVENEKSAQFDKVINFKERTFSLKYIGFNGQLSNIALPLNSGKTYQVYVAGDNLNPKDYKIYTASPYLKVDPKSLTTEDFGKGISVVGFEITSKPFFPTGEYSITVEKSTGEKMFFVGVFSSDSTDNPWDIVSKLALPK